VGTDVREALTDARCATGLSGFAHHSLSLWRLSTICGRAGPHP